MPRVGMRVTLFGRTDRVRERFEPAKQGSNAVLGAIPFGDFPLPLVSFGFFRLPSVASERPSVSSGFFRFLRAPARPWRDVPVLPDSCARMRTATDAYPRQ